MVCALDFFQQRPFEVAIVGVAQETALLLETANKNWLPNRVISLYDPEGGKEAVEWIPLLADKGPVDGKAAAYVCRDFTCSAPVADTEELAHLLQIPNPRA